MRNILKLILVIPIALALGGCITNNPNQIGFGLGGAALGGIAGSHIGKGRGKLISTAVGALLGSFAGGAFGNRLDQVSRNESGIIRNHHAINDANKRHTAPLAVPVTMTYPSPTYHAPQSGYSRGNSVPLNCSVRNNYVVCNGS